MSNNYEFIYIFKDMTKNDIKLNINSIESSLKYLNKEIKSKKKNILTYLYLQKEKKEKLNTNEDKKIYDNARCINEKIDFKKDGHIKEKLKKIFKKSSKVIDKKNKNIASGDNLGYKIKKANKKLAEECKYIISLKKDLEDIKRNLEKALDLYMLVEESDYDLKYIKSLKKEEIGEWYDEKLENNSWMWPLSVWG